MSSVSQWTSEWLGGAMREGRELYLTRYVQIKLKSTHIHTHFTGRVTGDLGNYVVIYVYKRVWGRERSVRA